MDNADLVEEDTEQLEPDDSPEATAEAGLTESPAEAIPPEDVDFEEDDAAVAMSPLPLAWMKDALRKSGLKVKAVEGWASRGRPFSFSPRAVVFHHTASNRGSGTAPSLGVCVKGRADLPGPLCHLMIGRDGTVFLVAAGESLVVVGLILPGIALMFGFGALGLLFAVAGLVLGVFMLILDFDFEFVPEPGAEARTVMGCIERLSPEVLGAQGVVYDTALRGVHHQKLLRDFGLMPINRVTAAKASATTMNVARSSGSTPYSIDSR